MKVNWTAAARAQLRDRFQHGQAGCVVDVDLIDARRVDRSHGPRDCMLANAQKLCKAAGTSLANVVLR